MAKAKGKPKYEKVIVAAKSGNISVYASPRISEALKDVLEDMPLYKGVRLSQVVEAIYDQGKKDGAKSAIEAFDIKFREIKKAVPHQNPGRPKKK